MTGKKEKPAQRSLARLLAVQALYLLHMNKDATPDDIISDFAKLSLGAGEGMPLITQVDQELFMDIVKNATLRQKEIHEAIEKGLTGKKTFERLETIMMAILEGGVYELIARPDIPHQVIINEYVDVAHAFYEGPEPGFVNGLLDGLAKNLRQ